MRINYPGVLPISSKVEEIRSAIINEDVVIVVGETGSGKSTQIPKIILEALAFDKKSDVFLKNGEIAYGEKIVCTQPRRIAATSISHRIAEECEVILGEEVGYKIRFDDNTTKGSVITICTDGILLEEIKHDQMLSEYNAVLVDEAHERNLNIDFLLGLLKEIQQKRISAGLRKLKIVVTSATFDTKKFAEFFGRFKNSETRNVPIINVSGRMFPVEIIWCEGKGEKVDLGYKNVKNEIVVRAALKVREVVRSGREGDILVFMPGEAEIFGTIEEIEAMRLSGVRCLPLYSRLSMEEQEKIFEKYVGKRNVVVATNIAETSLTVPGVVFVIDSGLAKLTDFDFKTGIGSLETRKISKAACIQRAGRAGRVEPGICYRLYSKEDFEERENFTKPEIQRSDLAGVVLHMIAIGIKDIYGFEFIDPPNFEAFRNAFQTLHELGAINNANELTELGQKMSRLPIEPRIAAMLLAAERYECVAEVAIIAAFLSVKDPFLRPMGEEEQADREKRYFQNIANNLKNQFKTIKIQRGKRVFFKKVKVTDSFKLTGQKNYVSDLLTFLVVWKKVFELPVEERDEYCKEHYLNYVTLQEVEKVYQQLIETLITFGRDEFGKYLTNKVLEEVLNGEIEPEGVLKAVATGLIQNICEREGNRTYKSNRTSGINVHPSSALFKIFPEWIVSAEIIETNRTYARNNSTVDPSWFEEIAPQLCSYKSGKIVFDEKSGQVLRYEDVYFKGHKIVSKRLTPVANRDRIEATEILIREGFIKGKLGFRFNFLDENEIIRMELLKLFKKTLDSSFKLDDEELLMWYLVRFKEKGILPSSKQEMKNLIEKNGDKWLTLDLEEMVGGRNLGCDWKESERKRLKEEGKDELKKINAQFPDSVWLNGHEFKIEYEAFGKKFLKVGIEFLNEWNFEDVGKWIIRVVDEKGNIIAEGENVENLKREVDDFYLKKNWKRARKEFEKIGMRRIYEVLEIAFRIGEKVLIGKSKFAKSENEEVFGVGGLIVNGKKVDLKLFREKKVAIERTKEALRWLFLKFAFAELNQKILDEVAKKANERGLNHKDSGEVMELTEMVEREIWKEINLEDKLGFGSEDFGKVRDRQFLHQKFIEVKKSLN